MVRWAHDGPAIAPAGFATAKEFLAFLKHIERTYRDAVDEHGQPLELHLVMDTTPPTSTRTSATGWR